LGCNFQAILSDDETAWNLVHDVKEEEETGLKSFGHASLIKVCVVVTPHDERSQQGLKHLYFSWQWWNWRRHGDGS
jgi:hypothetical protein